MFPTKTKTYPSDEAWEFFMKHKDAIRALCEDFLPVPEVQIPNTRVYVTKPDGTEVETNQRAAGKYPAVFTIAAFDLAVDAKDSEGLSRIMNDAWLRAPESRSVYRIPGFSEMCSLLDGTQTGFIDMHDDEEGEDYRDDDYDKDPDRLVPRDGSDSV